MQVYLGSAPDTHCLPSNYILVEQSFHSFMNLTIAKMLANTNIKLYSLLEKSWPCKLETGRAEFHKVTIYINS